MKNIVPLLLALVFAGCVTREDIRGIQSDLYTIQKGLESKLGSVENQTTTVQTSQADLRLDMQELGQNISALNAELIDNQRRMTELGNRLDDLEATLKQRLDAQIELLSGSKFVEKPLPSTVFNLANSDFSRGKYADANKGFKNYLERFPKAENASEAKLKIADSYAKMGQYDSAIEAYDDLVKSHPVHRLVATALLRKGRLYETTGKTTLAKDVYTHLIKKYPTSPEAKTAQDSLRSLPSPQ